MVTVFDQVNFRCMIMHSQHEVCRSFSFCSKTGTGTVKNKQHTNIINAFFHIFIPYTYTAYFQFKVFEIS